MTPGLPPFEVAQLNTQHLWGDSINSGQNANNLGEAMGLSSAKISQYNPLVGLADNSSSNQTAPGSAKGGRRLWRWSISPGLMGVIVALIILPAGFVYAVQPRQPKMETGRQEKMAAYLDENRQNNPDYMAQNSGEYPQDENEQTGAALTENSTSDAANPQLASANTDNTSANVDNTANPEEDPLTDPDRITAELASNPDIPNKTYAYHLTLSQGFLRKAIELSQTTKSQQSESDKQNIKTYLDKALEASEKAIEIDPREGAGFMVRARVYKTGAVLDPQLTELGEQDLQIARALGITSAYLEKNQDIFDLLPTQEAQDLANAPVIADPDDGSDQTIANNTQENVKTGTVLLNAGETTATVNYPELTANQSLQVSAQAGQNTQGAVFSIANRTEGEGFTVSSSRPLNQNITLEWRAISE